jgi:hypothetical protein
LFQGRLTQQQVDGQEFILDVWEETRGTQDIRYLGYELATSFHETSTTMWPIEEYGKGKGQPYGVPDSRTGETYYGRGLVQLTWYDNYFAMTPVVDALFPLEPVDLVNHPEQALVPKYASAIMFIGMEEGSFRKGHMLSRYFNATNNDPFEAREIINGDKNKVPTWSNGVSIGKLIAGYHNKFVAALNASAIKTPPETDVSDLPVVTITTSVPIQLWVNGSLVLTSTE